MIALALVAVFFVGGWTLQAVKTQWEYKVEYEPSEKKINQLGGEGWELVAVGSKTSTTVSVLTYVFKRQK